MPLLGLGVYKATGDNEAESAQGRRQGGTTVTTAVFLNNDKTMPLLGLGVYKATGDNEAESAIVNAVQCGYRLIDTASAYKNEENVGRGIARCGVPRKELFITTKIWNNNAVQCGYRLIDTASAYKNEENVGRGIARCGVPRKELFITTKIWNNAQRLGDVSGAFQRSLDRLGLDYVDLYLIHWPVPGCYLSTWKEMEKILWALIM